MYSYIEDMGTNFKEQVIDIFQRNGYQTREQFGKSGMRNNIDFLLEYEDEEILVECMNRSIEETDIFELIEKVNDQNYGNGILVGREVSEKLIDFSRKLQNIEIFVFDTLDNRLKEKKIRRRTILPQDKCKFHFFVFNMVDRKESIIMNISDKLESTHSQLDENKYRFYLEKLHLCWGRR